MKLFPSYVLVCSLLGCALPAICAAQGPQGRRPALPPAGPPPQPGFYTTVSGVISQFNYDADGEIEGFMLGNKSLVHLPPRASSRIAGAVRTGDNVEVSGLGQTSAAGVQTIEAQHFQDKTSGKAFTVPQRGAAAQYSGSGRIQQ